MSKLALQRIREAKEQRLITLDLANCGLTELPEELFELTWLEELILTDGWNEYSLKKKRWEEFKSQNTGETNNLKFIHSKIELLKNLRTIIACGKQDAKWDLTDLSPLKDLTALQRLRISSTQVADLSPLKNLTTLQLLYVHSTQVTDLSPLTHLTGLQQISVYSSFVTDLSPLTHLTALQQIWISYTQVRDLSPLTHLNALQQLNVSNTQVYDLSPLTHLNALQQLNVSNTQVRDLSPLTHLNALQIIDVSNTQVRDLSPLTHSITLQGLNISNTQVHDLSPLTYLTALQILSVDSTQVNDLSPLKYLTLLQVLSIGSTQVHDLDPLKDLIGLQLLNISNTRISDLSPLTQLTALQRLYVYDTQVHDLSPLTHLIEKGVPVKWANYAGEEGIFIKDSPLTNPSKEIVEQGNEAILNYWKQIDEQGSENINETKLLIVGEGGTGKTTLFRKLKDHNHNPLTHPTGETHGINILEGLPIGTDFHVNLWDFGGQELQYMTHQFFLTPRALYVLMMDARKESANLAYWFKIISLLGRDNNKKAQLLLVFNKRTGTTGTPQYQDLLKHYEADFDYQFLEVNFAINNFEWDFLKLTIEHRLKALAFGIPRQWVPIREALREEAQINTHITMQRLAEICTLHRVSNEQDQLLVIKTLHILGQVLYFEEKGLRGHLILSPKWAVAGVYAFLEDVHIKEHNGHFTEGEFVKILADKTVDGKRYSEEDAKLILKLITRDQFDICYKSEEGGDYVAAQLLPDNKPPQYTLLPKIMESSVLQFRYQYPTMPKGLISRLIVRLSRKIAIIDGIEVVWKKGAILHIEKDGQICRVLIREDDAESRTSLRQIIIEVTGKPTSLKFALQEIRNEVKYLHERWFGSISADEMVPCCCSACLKSPMPQLYKLENLLKLRRKGLSIPVRCYESAEEVSTQRLLESIYQNSEIEQFDRPFQNLEIEQFDRHLK